MVPLGPELRIYYCGSFLRSEVVRDGRNVGDVAQAAATMRDPRGGRR